MKALAFNEFGGPDKLRLQEVPEPRLGPSDADAMPLPSDETTPPVMITILAITKSFRFPAARVRQLRGRRRSSSGRLSPQASRPTRPARGAR